MREKNSFIGLSVISARKPLHVVVLDAEMRTLFAGMLPLAQALEQIDKYPQAVCAIDTPLGVNQGILAGVNGRLRYGLPANATLWQDFRVCEFMIAQAGMKIANTPPPDVPASVRTQLGWQVVEALRQLGFVNYRPGIFDSARQLVETHPESAYTVCLGHLPRPKSHLFGQLQRQMVLYDVGLDVQNPLRLFDEISRQQVLLGKWQLQEILPVEQMDAHMAAYTAWLAMENSGQLSLLGDPLEGQIALPMSPLKRKYLPIKK
jgi:hypothetical protein